MWETNAGILPHLIAGVQLSKEPLGQEVGSPKQACERPQIAAVEGSQEQVLNAARHLPSQNLVYQWFTSDWPPKSIVKWAPCNTEFMRHTRYAYRAC